MSEKGQALVGQLVFNFHSTVRIVSEAKPLGVGERTSRSVGIQCPFYRQGRIRNKTPSMLEKGQSIVGQLVLNVRSTVRVVSEAKLFGVGESTSASRLVGI